MPKIKKIPMPDAMAEDPALDMMNPLRKRKKTKMRAPVLKVKPAKRRV